MGARPRPEIGRDKITVKSMCALVVKREEEEEGEEKEIKLWYRDLLNADGRTDGPSDPATSVASVRVRPSLSLRADPGHVISVFLRMTAINS